MPRRGERTGRARGARWVQLPHACDCALERSASLAALPAAFVGASRHGRAPARGTRSPLATAALQFALSPARWGCPSTAKLQPAPTVLPVAMCGRHRRLAREEHRAPSGLPRARKLAHEPSISLLEPQIVGCARRGVRELAARVCQSPSPHAALGLHKPTWRARQQIAGLLQPDRRGRAPNIQTGRSDRRRATSPLEAARERLPWERSALTLGWPSGIGIERRAMSRTIGSAVWSPRPGRRCAAQPPTSTRRPCSNPSLPTSHRWAQPLPSTANGTSCPQGAGPRSRLNRAVNPAARVGSKNEP